MTHTDPADTAIPEARTGANPRSGNVDSISAERGSILVRSVEAGLATHTPPAPTAKGVGASGARPTSTVPTISFEKGLTCTTLNRSRAIVTHTPPSPAAAQLKIRGSPATVGPFVSEGGKLMVSETSPVRASTRTRALSVGAQTLPKPPATPNGDRPTSTVSMLTS